MPRRSAVTRVVKCTIVGTLCSTTTVVIVGVLCFTVAVATEDELGYPDWSLWLSYVLWLAYLLVCYSPDAQQQREQYIAEQEETRAQLELRRAEREHEAAEQAHRYVQVDGALIKQDAVEASGAGTALHALLKLISALILLPLRLIWQILLRLPFALAGAICGVFACIPVFIVYAIATGGDGLFTSHLPSGHWLYAWPLLATVGISALIGGLFPGLVVAGLAGLSSAQQPKHHEPNSPLVNLGAAYLAHKWMKGEGREGVEQIKRGATHGLEDWFDKHDR